MKLFAKVEHPNSGYDYDKEDIKVLDFTKMYEVEFVSMGQSHTNFKLKDINIYFNSVNFEFYNEDGNIVDIFKMSEYNPYL